MLTILSVALYAATALATRPLSLSAISNMSPNQKSANIGELCSTVAIIKHGDQVPLVPPVCPLAEGSFSYLCGLYPYELAADACAAYGWRLAALTPESEQPILSLMSNCSNSGFGAWVSAVNGLPADPCAIAYVERGEYVAGILNTGSQFCEWAVMPVICEVMPQVTIVETVKDGQTIGLGETTTTTTALSTRTVRPHHPHRSSSTSSSSDCDHCPNANGQWGHHHGHHHYKDQLEEQGRPRHWNHTKPHCYGQDCLPVCNASIGGIHLLTGLVNYTRGAEECAKYGWSLLDFTYGRQQALQDVIKACVGPTEFFFAHIGSFNGVSAPCPVVQVIDYGNIWSSALVAMSVSDSWCYDGSYVPVFCQEQCAFQVAPMGAETGEVSLTTTTTSISANIYTPTNTVVITKSCTETVRFRRNK